MFSVQNNCLQVSTSHPWRKSHIGYHIYQVALWYVT